MKKSDKLILEITQEIEKLKERVTDIKEMYENYKSDTGTFHYGSDFWTFDNLISFTNTELTFHNSDNDYYKKLKCEDWNSCLSYISSFYDKIQEKISKQQNNIQNIEIKISQLSKTMKMPKETVAGEYNSQIEQEKNELSTLIEDLKKFSPKADFIKQADNFYKQTYQEILDREAEQQKILNEEDRKRFSEKQEKHYNRYIDLVKVSSPNSIGILVQETSFGRITTPISEKEFKIIDNNVFYRDYIGKNKNETRKVRYGEYLYKKLKQKNDLNSYRPYFLKDDDESCTLEDKALIKKAILEMEQMKQEVKKNPEKYNTPGKINIISLENEIQPIEVTQKELIENSMNPQILNWEPLERSKHTVTPKEIAKASSKTVTSRAIDKIKGLFTREKDKEKDSNADIEK